MYIDLKKLISKIKKGVEIQIENRSQHNWLITVFLNNMWKY